MKIYTKKGDAGTTSLVGGERTGKDDPRVEAYGTVDELSAFLAFLRDSMPSETMGEYREDIRLILNSLMNAEAVLASGETRQTKVTDTTPGEISFLEGRIDAMASQLPPLTQFTIPGGHPLVSAAHICRTVCRRAERAAVKASRQYDVSGNVLAYLNRLSDYLYQLGRTLSLELNAEEELWEPPGH